MENKATKTMLTFGLILGFASILIYLLNYSFGDIYFDFKGEIYKSEHKLFKYLFGTINFISSIAIITLGIKSFKTNNNGFLSLGQAIKTGLGISLISTIFYILFYIIFIHFVEPNYIENALNLTQQTIIESRPETSDEQMEMILSWTKKMISPIFFSGILIVISLFIGLIISLIAGAIMKNEEHTF